MFKQIIPATGWWLRREVSEGEFIDEPLVAWGLYENPEHDGDAAVVIPPFFGALKSRGHAACAKRCFGV